ncbi:hypothetical protein RSAG8_00515, partial [Rhizoctonia solani AG-8 WAC10335]
MSSFSSYAYSLMSLGLESPSSQEFVDRPELRTISAFFLGWTFIACLRYIALATIRHPFTAHLLRATLRKPILITASERRDKNLDLEEGNRIQNWLRSTLESSTRTASDRPEGTRHLSVVLTAAFTLAILTSFLSLLDFRSSDQDVLCIVVIAWAGISISCAKLAGLLRITFDLQRLGAGRIEKIVSWVVLVMSFGATLAHVTISIGATRDVRELPGISLCYRRHFLLTSLVVSLLNIVLELYFMGRTFFLLVPHFLQFHHKVEVMMDVRVARVASILALDLLTFLPLGALLVLAAFNHHPPKPTDAQSFRMTSSHRTSAVTFPRNDRLDEQSVNSEHESDAKPEELPIVEPARPPPSRKSSLSSEPVPAIPYGIYQPKLMASPKIIPRATQSPSPSSDVGTLGHSGFKASPSPLSRDSGTWPEEKPLPPPKLSVDIGHEFTANTTAAESPSRNPIVYGSNVVRSPGPRKPELAHRVTSSARSVSAGRPSTGNGF